jgi:hypothetical protein
MNLIVKELKQILDHYNENTEILIVDRYKIQPVICVEPSVNMDTNKTSCVIYINKLAGD